METPDFLKIILGAILAFAGGYFQITMSNKKNIKKEDRRLKKELLTEFMANRMALGKNKYSEQFKVPFMVSLDKINIVFSDDENVIKSLFDLKYAMDHKNNIDNEIYKLTTSMYTNLKLIPPSKEDFFRYTML